jgi:hypothetical protein
VKDHEVDAALMEVVTQMAIITKNVLSRPAEERLAKGITLLALAIAHERMMRQRNASGVPS